MSAASVTTRETISSGTVLVVEAGDERFSLPHAAVTELVQARPGSANLIEWVGESPVMRLRGALLPLTHLEAILGDTVPSVERPLDTIVVVMQACGGKFGVIVDAILQTEEVATAALPHGAGTGRLILGGAVMADGTVTVVLDPAGIAAAVGTAACAVDDASKSVAPLQDLTSMLLFRAGSQHPRAVPLALVSRIENVSVDRIETCGSGLVLQYREGLMPLTAIEGVMPAVSGNQPILVFSDGDRSVGLLVDEVIDIVEEHLDITIEGFLPHSAGSAVLRGRATEILDVGCIMPPAASLVVPAKPPALRQAA